MAGFFCLSEASKVTLGNLFQLTTAVKTERLNMLLRAKDILVSLVNLSALKRSGKTKETREEKKMKAKEFWRTLKTRI